jgi:hypothetical protein
VEWRKSDVTGIKDNLGLSKRTRSRNDISNGSTVKAFSTVGLQYFKMMAGAQDGGIDVAWQVDFYGLDVYLCRMGSM